MKECWLYLPSWEKCSVTEALEAGVDGILTEDQFFDDIRALGRITVASPEKGDVKIPDEDLTALDTVDSIINYMERL